MDQSTASSDQSTASTDFGERILKEVFGYHTFRPGQQEIVDLLAAGENVLVVMPTGAGKSLCYQIPALMSDRLSVVVSPLVALMDDQVAALRSNGVAAACIHSGLPREVQVASWRQVAAGESRILYLSPERLMTERMLAAIERLDPGLFVVDEAHCISKWGVSFRPDYDALSGLCERFPGAAIAGFTATADEATQQDIAGKLFRGRGRSIVHGFDRPNLRLGALPRDNWKRQITAFLDARPGESGIVYCLSRKSTEEVAAFLLGEGHNAIPYHAGQESETRRAGQNRFMTEDAVIMVATIAFGMGIDKPDIRFVVHLNLPGSMEAYYQEIGRAGRDGAPAETLLLYGYDDIRMRRQFIEQDGEDEAHRLREHRRLDALLAYCEASSCRRVALLSYFGEDSGPCGNCDNCLDPPRLIDGTDEARLLFEAIGETGGFFGRAHVIDVVRGMENQKILERGHDRLSVYGKGAARDRNFWQGLVNQLVAGGFLSVNIQKYGALEMTAKGAEIARGEASFSYREIVARKKGARRERKAREAPALADPAEHALLARLKELRLALAQARNVPAYVVFPDSTLEAMVRARPGSLEAMAEISGVGPVKLETYGEAFLEAIAADG